MLFPEDSSQNQGCYRCQGASVCSAPGHFSPSVPTLCPRGADPVPLDSPGFCQWGAPEGHLRDRGEVKVSVPLPLPQGGLGLALTLD